MELQDLEIGPAHQCVHGQLPLHPLLFTSTFPSIHAADVHAHESPLLHDMGWNDASAHYWVTQTFPPVTAAGQC